MRHLVLAALLAMPALALAEPTEITGTDSVRFMWEAATGSIPTVAYEAKLVYLDGTESASIVTTAAVTGPITPRKGIPFSLKVRACRLADTGPTVCDGEWGEPSDAKVLCPLRADIDCDLKVGARDFVILSRDWGQTADEAPDGE